MKIAIRITVDIDADEWINEYGVDRDEVRADVRRYIETAIWEMPVGPNDVLVK